MPTPIASHLLITLTPKKAGQTFDNTAYAYQFIVNSKSCPTSVNDVNLFAVDAGVLSVEPREIKILVPFATENANKPVGAYYFEVLQTAPDGTTGTAGSGLYQVVQGLSSPRP